MSDQPVLDAELFVEQTRSGFIGWRRLPIGWLGGKSCVLEALYEPEELDVGDDILRLNDVDDEYSELRLRVGARVQPVAGLLETALDIIWHRATAFARTRGDCAPKLVLMLAAMMDGTLSLLGEDDPWEEFGGRP